MILDTSFIIDYIRGNETAKKKFEELTSKEKVILTPVNAYELQRGAEKYYKTEREEKKIMQALQKIPGEKVPIRWKEGELTASFESKLKESGNKIETMDIIIAAVAKKREQPILTGNPEHFQKIDGVKVEGY